MSEFLDAISAEFNSTLSAHLARLCVPDVPNLAQAGHGVRVVLLCESPDTGEVYSDWNVCNRYPLTGQTGIYMGRCLTKLLSLGDNPGTWGPIGKLVKERGQQFSFLGIMNTVQLPIRSEFYEKNIHDDFPTFISFLNQFVRDPGGNSRTPRYSTLRTKIENDLCTRLGRIQGGVKVICVGNVAKALYEKLIPEQNREDIPPIHHPSRKRWTSDEEDEIKRVICDCLSSSP